MAPNADQSSTSQPGHPPQGAPVLELIAASIASPHFAHWAVLEHVNLSVLEGEFWVVGGLPGSGKSQLLETLAGLLPPLGGTVRLFGRDAADMGSDLLSEIRPKIALVYGDGGRLFPELNVAQNVALPLRYHRNSAIEGVTREVSDILTGLGLHEFSASTPNRLNRTWRQRVAFARALALQPEVVLLDNPLAGVDPRQTRWWLEFLRRLPTGEIPVAPRTRTVVIATDNLRPWLAAGRRFGLLREGAFLSFGPGEDLSASKEPLLRELLADSTPT